MEYGGKAKRGEEEDEGGDGELNDIIWIQYSRYL